MLHALIQDVTFRSALLERAKVDVPQSGMPSSSSTSLTLCIDLDDLMPRSASDSLAKVERVLNGLIARRTVVNAQLFWSGGCEGTTPATQQATLALLRSFLPRMEKAAALVASTYPAWRAAVQCAFREQHSKRTIACTRNPDALNTGMEVCRNVDQFLQDGVDIEMFSPGTFVKLCPGFRCVSSMPTIAGVEVLMQQGHSFGAPQADEPHAMQVLAECGHRSNEPMVAVTWMLQRIGDVCQGLPVMTLMSLRRLFPSFGTLDIGAQQALLATANAAIHRCRPACAQDEDPCCLKGILGDALRLGMVGPWVCSVVEHNAWSGNGVKPIPAPWQDVTRPLRKAIAELLCDLLRRDVVLLDDVSGGQGISRQALMVKHPVASAVDIPRPASLWPKRQRAIDLYAVAGTHLVVQPCGLNTAAFYVGAGLASDLAAPEVLHPAIFLSFALLVASRMLYEWEWVALLTAACVSSAAQLNPLVQCSQDDLVEVWGMFLAVYDHVCRLNEMLNGALFTQPAFASAAEADVIGSPIPRVDVFRHLVNAASRVGATRQSAHDSYVRAINEQGTCCVFAKPVHTPQLSTYHRILRGAVHSAS